MLGLRGCILLLCLWVAGDFQASSGGAFEAGMREAGELSQGRLLEVFVVHVVPGIESGSVTWNKSTTLIPVVTL